MVYLYIILGFGYYILLSLVEPSTNIFFKFLILRDYKKIHFESEYYRDILKYSPSEVLFIYERGYRDDNLNSYGIINKYKKLFYINLLKMYLLGYVNIDFSNGTNFKIIKNDVLILDKEYKMIYDCIFNDITQENSIMLNDIYNYVEENYQNNYFYEEWDGLIREKLVSNGFYSNDFIANYGNVVKKYYIFGSIFLLVLNLFLLFFEPKTGFFCFVIYFSFIVLGYYKSKNIKMFSNWSIYEYKKVRALKKFLKEFTIIEERPVEYVKLLEDYIVYAAIFDMHDLSIEGMMMEIKLFLAVNIVK